MKKFLLSIVILFTGFLFVTASSRSVGLVDIVKIDTLYVVFSHSNQFYYYENAISQDGSNLKVTSVKGIKKVIESFREESRKENNELFIILKRQDNSTLSEEMNAAIGYIRSQKHIVSKTDAIEEELIKKTEEVNN